MFAQSTQQQQQQQYLHTNGVGSEFGYDAATSQSQRDAIASAAAAGTEAVTSTSLPASQPLLSNRWPTAVATPNGHAPAANTAQHFDGSFEFIKYLRHSTDFTPNSSSGAGVGDTADNAATAEKCSKLIVAGGGSGAGEE